MSAECRQAASSQDAGKAIFRSSFSRPKKQRFQQPLHGTPISVPRAVRNVDSRLNSPRNSKIRKNSRARSCAQNYKNSSRASHSASTGIHHGALVCFALFQSKLLQYGASVATLATLIGGAATLALATELRQQSKELSHNSAVGRHRQRIAATARE